VAARAGWAGLLALGSMPCAGAFPPGTRKVACGGSPITVARPRRISTGFPVALAVTKSLFEPVAGLPCSPDRN